MIPSSSFVLVKNKSTVRLPVLVPRSHSYRHISLIYFGPNFIGPFYISPSVILFRNILLVYHIVILAHFFFFLSTFLAQCHSCVFKIWPILIFRSSSFLFNLCVLPFYQNCLRFYFGTYITNRHPFLSRKNLIVSTIVY